MSTNVEYLDILFNLLMIQNHKIVKKAWDLLEQLPTNEKILTNMRSLGGVLDPGKILF